MYIPEVLGLAHSKFFPLSSTDALQFKAGGVTLSLKCLPIKESPGSGVSPSFVEHQTLRELSELQESSRNVKTKYTQLPTTMRQLCVCLFSNPS